MLFQELHRGQQDQAARVAAALLVLRGSATGVALHRTITTADPTFKATSETRWTGYMGGVFANRLNGEDGTNRRWSEYPSDVKKAARQLAKAAEARQ